MEAVFTINGKLYRVDCHTVPADISLGSYLRYHVQLKGTKFVCREGGCGACIVNVTGMHPVTKERDTWAVNSCLFPLFSCHGLDILTVEGIGNKREGYHPTQTRLAHFNGTQCGFCSPGMVMNMYSLMESNGGKVTMEEVENSFGGNICRCTGYRPILDAFKSLAIDADPKLLEACQDIEELPKICPNSGKACGGKCSVLQNPDLRNDIHLKFEDNKEWYKVTTVSEIFRVLDSIGSRPYMLVAGNTATGVYRRSNDLEVFIDVNSVEELRSHSLSGNLTLGGNVTLSDLMKILTDTSTVTGFEYCKEIVNHVNLVANMPVRNTGTVAGNLSIKHQHNEFPSDIFLTLETAGAKLVIAESPSRNTTVSLVDFLATDMKGKLILKVILYPLDPKVYIFRTYKIMPRAQNAHAYVNAGFLLKMDNAIVQTATICYGGINPRSVHIRELESFLVGINPFKDETLQSALTVLHSAIHPDATLPEASPEYRRNLASALFYRAMLSAASSLDVPIHAPYITGSALLERPLSTGGQSYETIQPNWPMTKNIPKVEALSQAAGEADYIDDLPNFPAQLFAAYVLATKPHSMILGIDPTTALQRPGVTAFFSAKDIPGVNNFMPAKYENQHVEEIFCSGRVLFHGQPVGVIVAETFEAAYQAVNYVDIQYSADTETPILPTVRDVLEAKAYDRVHHNPNDQVGETYAETAGGDLKFDGTFATPSQFHLSMETQQCICVPVADGLDVYSSTQWVALCQTAIAEALQVPENSLNFRIRRLGGAFGSKISRASQTACACAIAAHFTQRPVRLITTLESNMEAVGKRSACIGQYQVEVNEEGKVRRLLNKFYQDAGCSLNEPIEVVTLLFYRNCYDTSNWKVVGHSVLTDSASTTYCRGPGTNEGISMAENMMEHIAHYLGKDPLEVRLQNIPQDSVLRQHLPLFVKNVDYEARRAAIAQFNGSNRWHKRGISIVPMRYPQYFVGTMHALVSIYYADGTVAITSGGIEMGQGVNTKVTQVAARTLGIPLEMIKVKAMANITSPNAIVSGGSMTSDAACYAVKNACEILMKRIAPVRKEFPDASWADLMLKCHQKHVDLSALFHYKMEDVQHYVVWGMCCTELEIDVLTGNVQIRRVDLLEDVGESISPGIDIGQIEGSFVMGIGLYLTEHLIYSKETGQLLTNRSWNYKPPGARDIPIDFRVNFIQKTWNEKFVLRSKTTGEPALNLTISLLFALRMALNSARQDAGLSNEWYSIETPCTPEQICLLAGNNIGQFKLFK